MENKLSRSRSNSATMLKQSGSSSLSAKYKVPDTNQGSSSQMGITERLLNVNAFKGRSKSNQKFTRRGGSKVAEIDKKLKAYEQLKSSPTDIVKRADLLEDIKHLCEQYIQTNQGPGNDRSGGVQALLGQAETELSFMNLFAEAYRSTQDNPKKALKKYFEGRDALAGAITKKHPIKMTDGQTPDTNALYTGITNKLSGNRSAVMQEIIEDDVALLKQMSTQSGIDKLLKKIIQEVLTNEDQIHFQETRGVASGAILAGQKDVLVGIKKKYRLDMQMDQTESVIRLSSLLHEMTHISIHEIFDNTVVHLAFDPSMDDNDVLALSAKRTKQVNELKSLLIEEKDLFSPFQYDALMEKVTYPTEGKNTLGSYAKAFKTKGLSDNEYKRIMDLESNGANNTLTEFDTVINQMFFMVNGWQIDPGSDFYKKLKEVAQDAYTHRNG